MSNRPKVGLGIVLLALIIAMPLSAASSPVTETSAPTVLLESFDATAADSDVVTLEASCDMFECTENDRAWARGRIREECGWVGGFMRFRCTDEGVEVVQLSCNDDFF